MKVVHALAFSIIKEGRKAVELNEEVRELLHSLSYLNISLAVVPWLVWVLINNPQVIENVVGSGIRVHNRWFIE